MRSSLLFSGLVTLAAAGTLPFNGFQSGPGSRKPRSAAVSANIFSRQSTFACSGTDYTCYDTQTCCGPFCCNPGYSCTDSLVGTCDPVCLSDQSSCGDGCCESGYYCSSDLTCYPTCTASQTTCGATCCDSGYYCSTDDICYLDTTNTCPSYQTTCGTTCCNLDETCDSILSTCSSKSSGSSESGDSGSGDSTTKKSSSSKKLPGKVVGGIVTGVIAGLALIVAAILWFFKGCLTCFGSGGKKEAGETPAEAGAEAAPAPVPAAEGHVEQPPPPEYTTDVKMPEHQVREIPSFR